MSQEVRIKCPHCGWVRSLPVGEYLEAGTATVVRGLGEELKKAVEKMQALLSKSHLDQANAWLDLPPCPHCGKPYRYYVLTRKVKP